MNALRNGPETGFKRFSQRRRRSSCWESQWISFHTRLPALRLRCGSSMRPRGMSVSTRPMALAKPNRNDDAGARQRCRQAPPVPPATQSRLTSPADQLPHASPSPSASMWVAMRLKGMRRSARAAPAHHTWCPAHRQRRNSPSPSAVASRMP